MLHRCTSVLYTLLPADNKGELEKLAKIPDYENDSLTKLKTKILQEFSSRKEARGIIFIKTRHSAITLSQWVQDNPKFADIGVKSSHVIGGGDQSDIKPMTPVSVRDANEPSFDLRFECDVHV